VKYCQARRRPRRRERRGGAKRKAERKDETGWKTGGQGREEERGAAPINPSPRGGREEEHRHRKMSLSGDLERGSSYKSSRITGLGETRETKKRGPRRERDADGVATASRAAAREFPFNAAARRVTAR